ncbi:hypothetical protein K438DRAFT_1751323 [Mycena galopus ATCC 62051]|nr:hypothetical protein K438DRAFT_1751323 [Mycena galopus ATCC 62051]
MQELILSGYPNADKFGKRLRAAMGCNKSSADLLSGTHGEEPRDDPMDIDSQELNDGSSDEELRPDAPPPPVNTTTEWSFPFPGAAQPLQEKGESFTERMDKDQFAAHRKGNLYYPFASKVEWQMASFLLRSGMTMKDIDDFLRLQLVRDCLPLSFKSAAELRGLVEKLPPGPQWKCEVIRYDLYPTKAPLVLYYRDPLECVQFLLQNPLIHEYLELVPTQKFRNGQQIYNEWITSDGAWEMQVALPDGATLIGTIATSDKTTISVQNGDRVVHPLLVSLANIQMGFLMKALNHAFMMTALIPVPKFLCDKRLRGLMERAIVPPTAAAGGHPMLASSGRLLNCYTPLAACIVDTPEAADIACVKGSTSHLTMASYASFGDPFRHPERTGECTWNLIQQVNKTYDPWNNIYQYLNELKDLRLSGVHKPFWRDWPLSTNPSRFLTPEPLHQLHKGFYDHKFQWCINILGNEELDFRLKVLQPRVGFRHFKEGVTGIKQLGGREHRELQRYIVVLIADAAPPQVVEAIRNLVDMRYFVQAPELDEESIPRSSGFLDNFHALKQSIIDAGGRTQDHFNIPKLELFHSLFFFIRWAGVPMQYTADVTEKTHSTEIKVPARTETNHRDYDPQIVRYLDRAEKMCLFDSATELASGGLDFDDEDEEDDVADNGPSAAGEASRPIRNLFHLAKTHREKYPHLESRMFTTSSTAFLLNRVPSLRRISIEEVAEMYDLPDLRPALGDYLAQLEYQRRPDAPIIGGQRRSTYKAQISPVISGG